MEIRVYLHNGESVITPVVSYDAAEVAEMLNDREVMVVVIGDLVVNKNSVNLIEPVKNEEVSE